MGLVVKDDGWRIPDALWAADGAVAAAAAGASARLSQPARARPGRDERDPARAAHGMQWNALDATGICSSSSAHRRFREWDRGGGVPRALAARAARLRRPSTGSSGSGWRWTARWARRRSAASRPAPIPLTELKRGETIAPHRGQGRPARDQRRPARTATTTSSRATTLESIPIERPEPTRGAAAGPLPRQGLRLRRGARARRRVRLHRRTSACRGEETQALKREAGFRARRWVVERTHSWLNRFRRILIRWEKRAETYLAMLHLACALITWRQRLPA